MILPAYIHATLFFIQKYTVYKDLTSDGRNPGLGGAAVLSEWPPSLTSTPIRNFIFACPPSRFFCPPLAAFLGTLGDPSSRNFSGDLPQLENDTPDAQSPFCHRLLPGPIRRNLASEHSAWASQQILAKVASSTALTVLVRRRCSLRALRHGLRFIIDKIPYVGSLPALLRLCVSWLPILVGGGSYPLFMKRPPSSSVYIS
ncbi:hypothetical protein BJX63DRAFT_340466 [Aspergillus granulosus]|uniref:Uncharacterized protein n=1 Tax=Aspergillus granulosus TaxID=176169 RepID=A0ABR4H372_9EURO